jgi:hypothetical protein
MDTAIHDWTEGRGEDRVLIHRLDDATSRLRARCSDADAVLHHCDLRLRWLRAYGRPLALYTDRHSTFPPQDKGRALPDAETPFGRALRERGSALIRAPSPQAKGRVERPFGTAQERVVKEMRSAKVRTSRQATAVLAGGRLAKHNRLESVPPRAAGDAQRPLGTGFPLAALLRGHQQRVVANDYTVRFENRPYQLDPPIYPGGRGGPVVLEGRLDGAPAIRLGEHYLKYHESGAGSVPLGGSAPPGPRRLPPSRPTPEEANEEGRPSDAEGRPSGVQPTVGRSGRTSAEPYPPDGAAEDTKQGPPRPAAAHPWRRGFPAKRTD